MAREFNGKIPRVPIDADTSAADKKIDALFKRVKGLKNISIDANVNQAQRRLETLAKRTNAQMSSSLINSMVKDFRTVLGAMKTEFENFGDTSNIYKGLEKTCDMIENRFASLNISIDKKQVAGLENILNTITDIKSIGNFSFDEIVSKQAVKNAEVALSDIRQTKKEINAIASKAEYITKTLNKNTGNAFSIDKLQKYQEKLNGLNKSLQDFYKIDDELIQNALVGAVAKINEALGQIDIQMPKAKSTAEVLSTGETLKELGAVEKKTKAIEEVTNRISKNSSIKGLKNLEQEAVNVTKVLSEMYEDGIRDTERYITLQYKLNKIFDQIGKRYGKTLKSSGARDVVELRGGVIDTIQQVTGTNLFDMVGMEDLFGDSDFSLFNKSLSKLRMKDIAELLLITGKTGDWVDIQKQVTAVVDTTADALNKSIKAQEGLTDVVNKTSEAREREAKAIEKATGAKIKYYEIDEKAARLSKQMRSFDDYKKGYATESYKASVDKMVEIIEAKKKQFPDKAEQLDQLLDKYAKNLATFINRDNQIGAQYPSVMISGAGNYNIKKHNKQMASWGKNFQYYDEHVASIEDKIRGFGNSGAVTIRGDEEDALEKLEARLEYMKYWHQVMVEVNKYYRKNKTLDGFEGVEPDELERIKKDLATMKKIGMYDIPYPQYALSNDNQNIKRIEGRVASLKKLKSNTGLSEENSVYKLWEDKQDMRIRISFEIGKPDQEVIDMLKGKSFKWSPKNNAWQRQLTDNAVYATKQLQKSLHEFYDITAQPQAATAAIEDQAKATEKLAEARLKLTPKNDGSGAYTAMGGKYEVQQDADGWKVHQRDNAGMWNLIGTYERLEDVRNDASLLAREEIVYTDEIIQEIRVLKEAYSSMDQQIRGHAAIVNKYLEVLSEVKSGAMGAAYAISQLNNVARNKGLLVPADNKAQEKMKETIELIGKLQSKYGTEKFGEIFGDIGTIDVSNAEAVYDALTAKENEYFNAVQTRMKAQADFTQANGELAIQHQKSESFMGKYAELSQGILEGNIGLEEANKQLQEFVGTINQSSDAIGEIQQKTQKANVVEDLNFGYGFAHLAQVLDEVDLDKFFKQFNIVDDQIDGFKQKFIEALKASDDFLQGLSSKDLTGNILDELIDDIVRLGSQFVEVEKQYEDFRSYMQGRKLHYDDTFKSEGVHEWPDFYKSHQKYLTKSSQRAMFAEDISELVDLFPELFNRDILEKGAVEQFYNIMEVWDKARADSRRPLVQEFSLEAGQGREWVDHAVGELYTEVLNKSFVLEEQLADVTKDTTEVKQEQANAASDTVKQIEAQAEAEKKLAEAATKTTEAKKKQNIVLDPDSLTNISVEELIKRDINEALARLRSATNNETTLFSLKGVVEGDDLVDQARSMVENIADQANLSLGKFNVKDDIIKVQLYNNELKVTVDQMYRLREATEETQSAQLELFSQSFSQNVKALNENNFDAESAQKLALSSIEKIRADAERAKYDLSDLENQAKAISAPDDITKFNAELKNTQNNIQAIKNSTATKSSMNPLINMQRDMKVANTELDTMQLKLDKLGDVDGVNKAAEIIADMRTSLEEYNAATTPEGQQKAYNEYSDLRHSFKAQMEYINAAKSLNESQKSEEKKTDPIREQYQSILDLVNKINAKSSEIVKYQSKDGGSGMFAGYIEQLQSEKSRLVSELKGITDEVNNSLSFGFVQGKEISVPFASFLDGSGAVSSFLNDTKTQAALTTEEIERLVNALQKSQSIDVQAATRVAEQFKSVQDTYQRLSDVTGLDQNNATYQALAGIFAQIMQYKQQLASDSTSWTPEESARLQTLIDQFTKYGNALADAGEKEVRYFAGKKKYSKDKTSIDTQEETKNARELLEVRKKLEETAKGITGREDLGDPIFTKFTKGADGIAKLDFSAINQATGELRTFSVEMGNVTKGIYENETTVTRAMSRIQDASKQMGVAGDLLGKLSLSGVNISDGGAPAQVQDLLNKYKALAAELAKGDGANQTVITTLTSELKMASAETAKLYKHMMQMKSAVESGQATSLGKIDYNGDIYGQLAQKAKEFAAVQGGATLELGKFDAATNTLSASAHHANGVVENFKVSMYGLGGEVAAQQTGVTKLATTWDRFKQTIGGVGKQLMTALVGYNVFYKAISEVRKGINYVKEIDLALTELKKVTDATEASYSKFLDTAADTAGKIGSTISEFTEASANFARLGYSMDESAEMAEAAIVYKNVADGLDTVEESTESIISTMKAFGIESSDVMGIIDRFNAVGNNFAITSAGIGEAMQRSASALYAGGNTLDESIALITAANSVIQNPEQVGTALKTLTLRLRGAKVELEEAGLETDNMAESTSTLQAKLKALTHGKVDIMVDADTFKNTTQILREMSQVWDEMTDIERASALELMGGKRQANILSSVITNFETVEEVIATSMDSSGSAIAENEKYLDSIAGKTDQLTNAMQTLWKNAINSDVVKGFLDLALNITEAIDSFGVFKSALVGVLFYLTAIKNINPLSMIKDGLGNIKNIGIASNSIAQIQKLNVGSNGQLLMDADKFNAKHIKEYANAVSNLSVKQQAAQLASAGLSQEHIRATLSANGATDADIKLAMAETKVASAKQKTAIVTGNMILAELQENGVKLSKKATNFLLARSEREINDELLKRAQILRILTPQEKEQILNAQEQVNANLNNDASMKGLAATLKAYSGMLITTAAMAVANWISQIETAKEKTDELNESYNNLQSSISELEGEISSFDSELSTIQDRIDELNKQDALSFAEAEELQNLKEQSAELQHQKDIREQILKAREYQEEARSLQVINNMLKTNAAGQQKAAEEGKKAGKYWGAALGAVAAVGLLALAPFTGGGSVAAGVGLVSSLGSASSVIAAGTAGAIIGGAVGEKVGYNKGLNDNATDGTLVGWYESYEKAIQEAQAQANEAESQYLSDITDDNYKKWQEKVEAVNTLQEQFYTGLEEMGEYVSNLDYTSETSHIIDGYNDMMAKISADSLEGNFDAQIESIQALEEEFKELSRGVDEHGNNVSLSTEEYARYNSIVKQVLSYQSGLVKGYNEVGDAILYASGEQRAWNELMDASVQELRKEKQDAAKAALDDTGGASHPIYWNIANRIGDFNPGDFVRSGYGYAANNPENVVTPDEILQKVMAKVGIEFNTDVEDINTFVTKHYKEILQHKDEILSALQEELTQYDPWGTTDSEGTRKASFWYTEGPDENEYFNQLAVYLNNLETVANDMEFAQTETAKWLSNVPVASDYYYDLSEQHLGVINKYIGAMTNNIDGVEDIYWHELEKMRDHLSGFVEKLATDENLQLTVDELIKLDPDKMAVGKLRDNVSAILDQAFADGLIDGQTYHTLLDVFFQPDELKKMMSAIAPKLNMSESSAYSLLDGFNREQLKILYEQSKDVEDAAWTMVDAWRLIEEHSKGISGPILQSYSALIDKTSQWKEAVSQTSDIVLNNTKVTQEYKDSLVTLGVSEEELAECFDATNNLVVTNAKKLQDLVDSTKDNIAENARLAKSQANLQYYELFKEMNKIVSVSGELNEVERARVLALYDEMNALEKTIAKYSMLEASLLGATDAYDKLEEAQAADEAKDYGSKAEEMVNVLGEALNTAELGTEAAQVAIEGLIPEEVFKDADTLDEKMQKIYEYFTGGAVSKLFTIEFDDDGGISSVEMTKENAESFADSLFSTEFVDENGNVGTVFQGTWDEFTLNPQIKTLEDFAEACGITEEVAFAFLTELEKYDISWLGGDYSTFLDQFLTGTNAGQIQLYTQYLADLTAEYAKGNITLDEYNKKYKEYTELLNGAKAASKSNILGSDGYYVKTDEEIAAMSTDQFDNYIDAQRRVVQVQDEVNEKMKTQQEAYQALLDAGLTADDIKFGRIKQEDLGLISLFDNYTQTTNELTEANTLLADLIAKRDKFEKPSQYEVEILIDDIDAELDQFDKDFQNKALQYFEADANGIYVLKTGVATQLIEDADYDNIIKFIGLLNSRTELSAFINTDEAEDPLVTLQSSIDQLVTSLQNIEVKICGTDEAKTTFQQWFDSLPKSVGVAVSLAQQGWDWLTGGNRSNTGGDNSNAPSSSAAGSVGVNGTAHATGTAFAGGSWGAPKMETSLVGELGPEILVRNGRWTTVGENGAEFTQVKKGDIIFNHKQSEQLLKNGYVTGRGKAYASGTLYAGNNIFDKLKIKQLAEYAEKMCKKYEELTNGNVDLRKRPHLAPSYEHDLAMSGGYNAFMGSDGQIYASTSAETVTIGNEKNQYTIDITPVLENGDVLTSDTLDEYINGLVTDGSTQDLLDSDKYNLVIRAIPGEYDEKDWAGFEDELSKYKDGYLDTIIQMFNLGGEKAVESAGFSSVGLADVAKDLQNNGSYDGKEIASAIDSTSDEMTNLDSLINQYVTDVLNAKSLADDIGTDLSQTKYGNVDTDNRQKLYWDEESVDKYGDAIDSWGAKADDLIGMYSTLFSAVGEFDGVDIAFTPMLQTENGPQLLDSGTVYKYIWGLIDEAKQNDGKWASDELFQLDTKGLEIDGVVVKNLLEDIGQNADKTAKLLHYVGATGAISSLEGEIESTSSELVATGENASAVQAKLDALNNTNISDKTFTVTTLYRTIGSGLNETVHTPGASGRYTKYANGTVHLGNNAYNNGNFGAKKTETALVGELGPEMVVRNGKWFTVGENGASFEQIKKGDIIFNHKQTESLLKNGYVTSRGKAYASGTTKTSGAAYAHAIGATIEEDTKLKKQLKQKEKEDKANAQAAAKAESDLKKATGTTSTWFSRLAKTVDTYQNSAGSSGSGSGSDAADEFEETFDWIEVRLEEINEQLDLMNAKLENAVGYANKNNIIDDMLGVNESKIKDLESGIKKYTEHAAKLLAEVPSQYRTAAQDGSIAITEFAGEADEATVEAINNYREWAQKVADLEQQLEEVNAEIRDLAKQKFDNIVEAFDNITDIRDHKTTKVEDAISLMEDSGYVAAVEYYEKLIQHENNQLGHLTKEREELLNNLNAAVESGQIQVGDDVWYEMLSQIYDVDHAIDESTANLEDYQNAINDIYWDNFDELINRLDYVKNETESFIDLMSHGDMVTKPEKQTYKGGTEEYWTADDVDFTDEGLATLGLYAQQMEIAEYQSKEYAKAIDDLTADYEAGKYSEAEYLEKLDELKEGQYESIEAYYDAKDAIVDLNKERVESIKEGIEAEIDAYTELIEKKKEELDVEQDLYSFQKGVAEQQKSIADIQRKIAALSGDNSASAVAKRKQLEAELYEAQESLEETYYDRSIQNQQDALDKSLEDFQEEKDAEIQKWDEYLENVEQIVTDSLNVVQANATEIGNTLTEKTQEYNLTVSDAVLTPWKDGALAVDSYTEKFGDSASSTIEQLGLIKNAWQEVIDKMIEAANIDLSEQAKENDSYTAATKKEPDKSNTTTTKPATTTSKAAPSVGSTVKVKTSATHFSSKSGGLKMASFVPGGSYTVYQVSGDQILIGKNGAYTGWVKKTDLQGYAKGSLGIEKDQWAMIDELGEELQIVPGKNGRVEYFKKGTGIIPADLTERIMDLAMNPQEVLDRNRPQITPSKSIVNNEINISMDIAEVVHIDKVTNDTLPDLTKAIEKQMDSYMVKLNNSIKRFSR